MQKPLYNFDTDSVFETQDRRHLDVQLGQRIWSFPPSAPSPPLPPSLPPFLPFPFPGPSRVDAQQREATKGGSGVGGGGKRGGGVQLKSNCIP